MRILQVVRQFLPTVGGVENAVLGLSQALLGSGVEVEVLTLDERFDTGQRLPPAELVAGIPVTRVPRVGPRRYPWAPRLTPHLKGFDLLHVHAHDAVLDWVALTRARRQPLVLTTHGGFFHTPWGFGVKRLFFSSVSRLVLRRVATVIAVSESDATTYRRVSRDLEVIPNGIDYARWSALDARPERGHFVFVGRLHRNKRLDRLIGAFALALRRGAPIRLSIAGPDWGARAPLERRLAGLALEDRIAFRGELSASELDALVASAQAAVLASDYEGFGISILEGMAAGLVPVVQDLPVMRELVPETAGFRCDFDDLDRAATVLAGVAALPEARWREMAAAARATARRYSWEAIAPRVRAVYERALARA